MKIKFTKDLPSQSGLYLLMDSQTKEVSIINIFEYQNKIVITENDIPCLLPNFEHNGVFWSDKLEYEIDYGGGEVESGNDII